jgi:two-component system, response regulator
MLIVGKPILLVEDNDNDESLFLRALDRAGLTNPITVIHTGEEALDYLDPLARDPHAKQLGLPGVLILDLKLPGTDGVEVLEWIRTQPRFDSMLIVVLTGSIDPIVVRRVYEMGADTLLLKPVMPQYLSKLSKVFNASWFPS